MNKVIEVKNRFKDLCRKINTRREQNSEKFHMTNLFLTVLFPIFIVLMAELNQGKYPSKLIMFIVNKPTVMLFNFVIAAVIFIALCLLFRKIWRAVALQSLAYFTLSIVELFKYGTNGNHLIMTDMKLFKSVKSLTSFAYIKITPFLIVYTIIVLAYIGLVFWFDPQIKTKFTKRIAPAITCTAAVLSMFFIPSVSTPVYSFFDVDTTAADNVFLLNEKFENNSFLAFFLQTASENISNKLREPENYSEEAIEDYLNVDVTNESSGFKKPNIIVVMSESYADFRVFDELNISDEYYKGFDRMANEGYGGKLIVPTFASFTVRTEFELLFGLPVKSLNDPNMPQRMLADRDQPSMARYCKSLGYDTAYVHPFLSSFYSRNRIYSTFGFDKMIFEDDKDTKYFTVPVEYNDKYVKDSTVFNQIEKLIKETDAPLYVHTTTMQNHQPYNTGAYDTELENYLANIKLSSDAVSDFIDHLSNIDEPTLLFLVGDHFPSFKNDEESVYENLGINSSDCDIIFEQSYYIWSNYGQDFSGVPSEKFSAFYVPYVLLDLIDAPKDTFIQAMQKKMETLPVYSTQYDPLTPNDSELDLLTYDRVIGENLSGEGENLSGK